MKKANNTLKAVLVGLICITGLFLLFCESESIETVVFTKVIAAGCLYATSWLFNRWRDAMPSVKDPES